jgi:hypothetical protein
MNREGSEDCVGVGGIALFGVSSSLDHVCAARPFVVDDVQHLCECFLVFRRRVVVGDCVSHAVEIAANVVFRHIRTWEMRREGRSDSSDES